MWSWAVYLSSLNLNFLTSKRMGFDLIFSKVFLPSSISIWQSLPSLLITNMETNLNKIVFIVGSSFKKQFYFTLKKIMKGRLIPFLQVFLQVWFLDHPPQSHLGHCEKKMPVPQPRPTESGPLGVGPGKRLLTKYPRWFLRQLMFENHRRRERKNASVESDKPEQGSQTWRWT